MSFKQRERQRKKRAAQEKSRRKAEVATRNLKDASHKLNGSSGKWWLTPVEQTTCCARCGGILRPGGDMVYRHTPREARCVVCADSDPAVSHRPSLKWERSSSKRRRRRTR